MNDDLSQSLLHADRAGLPDPAEAPDISRREALEKLGKLAGYTAPVMLSLLVTRKARADSPPCDPDGC